MTYGREQTESPSTPALWGLAPAIPAIAIYVPLCYAWQSVFNVRQPELRAAPQPRDLPPDYVFSWVGGLAILLIPALILFAASRRHRLASVVYVVPLLLGCAALALAFVDLDTRFATFVS